MSLALYGHPFSSYTQKALIALYENRTPFEFRCLGPDSPQHLTDWLQRWPLRKFPLLVDGERNIVETSIIIEYLQLVHPGPVCLLPADPMAALEVRFLDRFFDLHVMDAMQVAVDSALKRLPMTSEDGLALAGERLERAYAARRALRCRSTALGFRRGRLHTGGLQSRPAVAVLRRRYWTRTGPHLRLRHFSVLRAYRARLLARPSFARAVDEARPYRSYFPLGAPDRD